MKEYTYILISIKYITFFYEIATNTLIKLKILISIRFKFYIKWNSTSIYKLTLICQSLNPMTMHVCILSSLLFFHFI